MRGERGLLAAIGIVMAFSILWTLAILVPDESSSAVSMQRFDGLVVDGNHYVLDTNVAQTRAEKGYKVIHAVKVKSTAKVKSPTNIKRKLNAASNPKTASTSTESAGKRNDSKVAAEQPRMSSFSYAWFALFICYHARNFLKKKNRHVLGGEKYFVKTGADQEYGLEYEDDYSVDTSFYGSISNWSELQKFDLDDDPYV